MGVVTSLFENKDSDSIDRQDMEQHEKYHNVLIDFKRILHDLGMLPEKYKAYCNDRHSAPLIPKILQDTNDLPPVLGNEVQKMIEPVPASRATPVKSSPDGGSDPNTSASNDPSGL